MKKLMILGLMLSLLAFSANNERDIRNSKVVYAAGAPEVGLPGSVTFPSRNAETCMSKSELAEYKDNIVKIEFRAALFNEQDYISIDIKGGTNDFDFGESDIHIWAYILKSPDYTESNVRYDCVLFTKVSSNCTYANADSQYMFAGFPALEKIDLSGLDMSNCDNLENFFMGCDNLKYIKCPKSLKSGKSIQLPAQFATYGGISEINSNNISTYPEISITISESNGTAAMFPDSGYYDSNYWYKPINDVYNEPFYPDITNIIITNDHNIVDDYINNRTGSFEGPIIIQNSTFIDADGNSSIPEEGVIFAYLFNNYKDFVLYADVDKIYANPNSAGMFADFLSLKSIDLTMLDTSNVTDMREMFGVTMGFGGCGELTKLDLSTFDTSNVTDMSGMFAGCSSLTELNISNFDTSKVTDMDAMFAQCTSLKKLDLSSFDMSTVGYLDIDASFFNTWFIAGCSNLDYVKLPKALSGSADFSLPSQFVDYYGVSQITSENIEEYSILNLQENPFVTAWKALRAEGGNDGICAALVNGTQANTKLVQLLNEYDSFDEETKKSINIVKDDGNVKIGDSITYVKNVLNGSQPTTGNYNGVKDDTGSFMTMSITEDSPYLIVVISLIGILSVVGYYFYNKKKQVL